jgi:uncharacterized protein YehS (DUF1456 family)
VTNNDILRRLRYTFDFNDSKIIVLFGLANLEVTRGQVSDWLKKEDDPAYQSCTDTQLAIFLNGLINDKRGKKEGPPLYKALDTRVITKAFAGSPIALIVSGILALAFMGFSGIVK